VKGLGHLLAGDYHWSVGWERFDLMLCRYYWQRWQSKKQGGCERDPEPDDQQWPPDDDIA
jgi:hypothetical protein